MDWNIIVQTIHGHRGAARAHAPADRTHRTACLPTLRRERSCSSSPVQGGDFITAGGITGTVYEIGLFVTTFDTPDNVRTHVGNNKISSDTIQNYSINAYPRPRPASAS